MYQSNPQISFNMLNKYSSLVQSSSASSQPISGLLSWSHFSSLNRTRTRARESERVRANERASKRVHALSPVLSLLLNFFLLLSLWVLLSLSFPCSLFISRAHARVFSCTFLHPPISPSISLAFPTLCLANSARNHAPCLLLLLSNSSNGSARTATNSQLAVTVALRSAWC